MKKSHNYSNKRTKEISFRKATGQHAKRRAGQIYKQRRIKDVTPDRQHNFGQDEEELLLKLHALLGNRWSLIAGRLPGRTKEEVEKYWNSHLKIKLVSRGLDPNNHHVNENICRPSSSSSCSCSQNINYHSGDDETKSSQQKFRTEVTTYSTIEA